MKCQEMFVFRATFNFFLQVSIPPQMIYIHRHTYKWGIDFLSHIIRLFQRVNSGTNVGIHGVYWFYDELYTCRFSMIKQGNNTITYLFSRFGERLSWNRAANQYYLR